MQKPSEVTRKYNKVFSQEQGMTPRQYSGGAHVSVDKAAKAAGADVITLHVYSFWGFSSAISTSMDDLAEIVNTYTGAVLEPVDDNEPRQTKRGRGSELHRFSKQYRIVG